MEHTAVTAAIFLPSTVAIDSNFSQQCLEHVSRHRYKLYSVVQEWAVIEQLLALRRIQVVVFARVAHLDPIWTPRFELVGENTREIVAGRKTRRRNDPPAAVGRHRRARLIR